jgi:hypothetical protein
MRLYIPLRREEYEALERAAYAERRRPRDQAAVILAHALADEPPRSVCDSDASTEATKSHPSREAERVSA